MNKIKCPKCGEVFAVDESDYENILKQVRTEEFNNELNEKIKLLEKDKNNELKLSEANSKNILENSISKYVHEIEKLKLDLLNKDKEASSKIKLLESENNVILASKISESKLEIEKLKLDLLNKDKEASSKIKLLESENNVLLASKVSESKLEIEKLKSQIESNKNSSTLETKNLKETYEIRLKEKEDIINYYKDLKTKMSTKMVGESLEVHCENEFNSLRATGFQNAYFEKDNDSKTGSKGDYIFRETTDSGVELISIMFEMKNEMDTTATKKKNIDFLKELDKDRTQKNCEYAILVSLLESDNEFYNNGIVDVSYKYPKMYIIRPQFFIPIITLLRNASKNALAYKEELLEVRNQNIDISNFENNILDFKDKFSRNYDLASNKFFNAIKEIDETIKHLEKTKASLLSSENNLRLANSKAQDLSIKKLVKNNPTMKEMFDNLDN